MDLRRNPDTGVMHLGNCPHVGKTSVPYRYAHTIPDKAALTKMTRSPSSGTHLCQVCLPGACACRDCAS